MESRQKKLAKKITDLLVPVLSKHLDVPQVLDADGVIFYPMGSSSTVAGLLLLVPMSPTFEEPVLFDFNHRNTYLNALRDETDMGVIEKGKNVIKKVCIAKELYENTEFDHMGTTAGAQLYFTLETQKTRASTQLFTGLQQAHFSKTSTKMDASKLQVF